MKPITLSVHEAKTFWEKSIGLIGTSHPRGDTLFAPHGLLLKTRFGIHTFGMRYAIDVLVLDKQNRVVKLKENLKPNGIFLWNPKCNMVIELPTRSIKSNQITIGSVIIFA